MAAALIACCGTACLDVPAQAQVQSGAYRAGLKVAKERRYSDPPCYARVFAQQARLINHHTKKNFWAITDGQRFTSAVWNECRISR